MTLSALTGNDSMTFYVGSDSRVLNDYADGDVVTLEFPNDIIGMKQGKNGNTLYAINQTGRECDVTLRLVRGSLDDAYFNDLYESMKSDITTFTLMNAQFVKKVGDGRGNVTRDIYQLSGGAFTKAPAAKENQEGDTEQSVTVYTMKFANAPRSLG
jgi:hypothetical protein